MRRWIGIWGLLLLGCTESQTNGSQPCAADAPCPGGEYCALDGHCWMDGTGPGAGADAGPDAGAGDLATPPGGAPPSVEWSCGGGGTGTGDTGEQLGVSVGGTGVTGAATGSGGEQMTFGAFSTLTY